MSNTESNESVGSNLLSGIPYMSAFPLAFVASLYSLVLYARAKLGAWPAPYAPDPKTIGISYIIFHLLTFVLFCVFLFTTFLMLRRGRRVRSAGTAVQWSAITVALWGAFIFVVKCDPGNYITWLYD